MSEPQRILASNKRENREEWAQKRDWKDYFLLGSLMLHAADHMSLEAATRTATVFVAFQISMWSAEKSG